MRPLLTPGCRWVGGLVAGGGERLATAMLYLSSLQWGGSTVFPQIGLSVTPEVGGVTMIQITQSIPAVVQERAALVWVNIKSDGTFDTRSCHAGKAFIKHFYNKSTKDRR